MGLYLRKSFRAGPLRINLSKSGLGLSAGVTGARVGIGPSGSYVHAGRGGLYYRKNLSSGQPRKSAGDQADGCATLLLTMIALGIGAWLLFWLIENPAVVVAVTVVAVFVVAGRWWIKSRRAKALAAYKQALDAAFVASGRCPSPEVLAQLGDSKRKLPDDEKSKKAIQRIESDVYQAVLDRVLDDGFIGEDEAAMVAAAERTIDLNLNVRLQLKKEIFSASYIEAIDDHGITEEELKKLENLIAGLAIPREEVQRELEIVQEFLKAQALRLPLTPLPLKDLAAPIQKSESAYIQCSAQVLSKRKSSDTASGYEYTLRREGTLVLTNKRVFVVGDGTTNIRFSDIGDVDVDIDEGVIEITKNASERPLVLKTNSPIYVGRAIDLLVHAEAGGNTP